MKIPHWLPAIIATSLPVLIQLVWLLHNTQLPVADADEQLSASFHVYKHAANHDWLSFITDLYYQRSQMWRPTGFYILQVPFQLISGGNLMFTTIAVTLLCTLITSLYIYSLLCLALTPASAVLGTTLLGLLPSVQWPATLLGFTECAFLPAVLASLYHLIRSDNLQDKRHRIYFIMAVVTAFAIRPVEALFHLALLLLIFLTLSWRKKIITTEQLYRIAFGALVSASILIISGIVNYEIKSYSPIFNDPAQGRFFHRTAVVAITVTLALWAASSLRRFYRWREAGNRFCPIELSFISIYGLVVLFYLRYVPQLVEWIYTCSFGSLAILNNRPPIHTLIIGFIGDSGLVPFLSIVTLGLMSFFFFLNREQRAELLRHRLLYLFTIIPVTLLMSLFSAQFLQRKVTVIIDVFLLALLVPALMRGRFWQVRNIIFALIAITQIYGVILIAYNKPRDKWLNAFTGGDYPRMIELNPNPNMVMFEFLKSTALHNGYKLILLPISTTGDIIIDPFLLSMLIENLDNGTHVGFPYKASYDSETITNFLHGDQNAFLLIKDTEGKFIQSLEETNRLQNLSLASIAPNDKLMLDLQALYSSGKFKDIGITKKDCIYVTAISREACVFELKKTANNNVGLSAQSYTETVNR